MFLIPPTPAVSVVSSPRPARAARTTPPRSFVGLTGFPDRPFFLFVHTYFVHNYRPAEQYLAPHWEDPAALLAEDGRELWTRAEEHQNEEAAGKLQALYDATVTQADEQIFETVRAAIDQRNLRQNTYFTLVSDHGEAFLEHGQIGHGKSLWGELIRVPWILTGPGIRPGTHHREVVDLADVVPTLEPLLGLPSEPSTTGRDVLAGTQAPPSVLTWRNFRETTVWDGVADGDWKLLRLTTDDKPDPQHWLFQWPEDQLDKRDLSQEYPEKFSAMKELLEQRVSDLEKFSSALQTEAGAAADVGGDLSRQLLELGYVSSDQ